MGVTWKHDDENNDSLKAVAEEARRQVEAMRRETENRERAREKDK